MSEQTLMHVQTSRDGVVSFFQKMRAVLHAGVRPGLKGGIGRIDRAASVFRSAFWNRPDQFTGGEYATAHRRPRQDRR